MKEGLTFMQLNEQRNKIIDEKIKLESHFMNTNSEVLIKVIEDRMHCLNDLLEEYETMPLYTIDYVYNKINNAKAWED